MCSYVQRAWQAEDAPAGATQVGRLLARPSPPHVSAIVIYAPCCATKGRASRRGEGQQVDLQSVGEKPRCTLAAAGDFADR